MMMTMMMISDKPDFKKAEKAAYDLLEKNRVNDLPIKVKSLIKHIPNLKIKKYSWYAQKHDLTIEETCELFDSDEGCCWYQKSNDSYIIFYNDSVTNKGRVRWTIAHEIGHFMLKHNEKNNKTVFCRNSLSKKEYEIYEKEANCFARTLLAPPELIDKLNIKNPTFLSDIFEISMEAAINVYRFFHQGLQMGVRYANKRIESLFNTYVYNFLHNKVCTDCKHSFVYENAQFCPVCGGFNIYQGGKTSMDYYKVEMDEQLRPVCCPRCENELHSGNYCQICGTYLLNKCTGQIEIYEGDEDAKWHKNINGCCDELFDGDARFCIHCGCFTTYYIQSILLNWKEEPNWVDNKGTLPHDYLSTNQDYITNTKKQNAYSRPYVVSDEDLPF